MISPAHKVMPLKLVKWGHYVPFLNLNDKQDSVIQPVLLLSLSHPDRVLLCHAVVFVTLKVNVPFKGVMHLCIHSGPAVFSECSINWCSVRCVGPEVLPAAHCVLHLRSHPSHEDQPMVRLLHEDQCRQAKTQESPTI